MHHQSPARTKGADGEAEATGRSPVDRGKSGTKRPTLSEGQGIPLAVLVTGANRTDMKKLGELLDAVVIERPWQAAPAARLAEPAAAAPVGEATAVLPVVASAAEAPVREAGASGGGVAVATGPARDQARLARVDENLCLDRGFDSPECRAAAQARGYTVHIPAKASQEQPLPAPDDPNRHPPRRWVVEVTHSWFNRFRRRLVRWEKDAANYLGFVHLAACLIIYRKLRHVRLLSG